MNEELFFLSQIYFYFITAIAISRILWYNEHMKLKSYQVKVRYIDVQKCIYKIYNRLYADDNDQFSDSHLYTLSDGGKLVNGC